MLLYLIVRGIGAGGWVGGIFRPLLVGLLLTKGYEISYIFTIFCIAIVIGVLAVIFLGKETKQTELQ